MRLPNDESRIDGRAFEIERARRAEAHSGESEVGAGREAGARRKEVPLDAERERDGLRENGRRNSEVRRGCGEAGKIRREQIIALALPLAVPLFSRSEGESEIRTKRK